MRSVALPNHRQEPIHRLPGIVACGPKGVETVKGRCRFGGDLTAAGKETQSQLIEDRVDGIHGDGFNHLRLSILLFIFPVVDPRPYGDGICGHQSVLVDLIADFSWKVEEVRRGVPG